MSKEPDIDEITAAWLSPGGGLSDDPDAKNKKGGGDNPDNPDAAGGKPGRGGEGDDDLPPISGDVASKLRILEERRQQKKELGGDDPGADGDKGGDKPGEGGDDDPPKEEPGGDPDKRVKFRLPRRQESTPDAPDPGTVDGGDGGRGGDEAGDTAPQVSLSEEDEKEVAELPSEHRDALDFWRDAEIVDEKHQGAAKKYLDYAKAYEAKVKELRENDPDFDPRNSPELAEWIRKQDRPEASRSEMRRIDKLVVKRDMEADQAKKDAERDRKLHAIEERPKVEKAVDKFNDEFATQAIPAEVMEVYQKAAGDDTSEEAVRKGMEAVADEFGDEVADLVRETHENAVGTASAYLNVTRGIERFDSNNRFHVAANNAVIRIGEQILNNPKLAHLREQNGKKFVPREKYFQLSPEERAKSFTLSDDDVLSYLRASGKTKISNNLEGAKEKAERRFRKWAERKGIHKGGANADKSGERDDPPDPPPSRMPDSPGAQERNDGALASFFVPERPD